MATLDEEIARLAAEVEPLDQTDDAVDAMVVGLLDRLKAAVAALPKTTPEAVAALIDKVKATRESLIASTLKGTAGEPE